ncbi:MAG TPA: hypothetical protein PK622_01110 [Saprospiraceae bacterium]|jgi:hypothetical protein|nr:hypothetical protein [Saprospiraceae bacterium]
MKFYVLVFFTLMGFEIFAQSGAVIGVGASLGYTDNPVVMADAGALSGWHISVTARLGPNFWYLKPGLELHKMNLLSSSVFNPFAESNPATYIVKAPVQIGARVFKIGNLLFRASAGIGSNFIWSIEKNSLNLNHNTMRDLHFGALGGLGIDLGKFAIDFNFEKGFSELYKDTGYKVDYITVTAGLFF